MRCGRFCMRLSPTWWPCPCLVGLGVSGWICCDPDEVADRRTLDMPLWRFARDVWDFSDTSRSPGHDRKSSGQWGVEVELHGKEASAPSCQGGSMHVWPQGCDLAEASQEIDHIGCQRPALCTFLGRGWSMSTSSWRTSDLGGQGASRWSLGEPYFLGRNLGPVKLCRHILRAAWKTPDKNREDSFLVFDRAGEWPQALGRACDKCGCLRTCPRGESETRASAAGCRWWSLRLHHIRGRRSTSSSAHPLCCRPSSCRLGPFGKW